MTTLIRDANEDDLDFLAWVIHTAGRSHLLRSPWEYLSGQTVEQTLAYHRQVAATGPPHMNHYSLFLIAEVDGQRAAALCGFDPATQGSDVMMSMAADIAAAQGVVFDDAFFERFAIFSSVGSEKLPDTWVIENVACHPDFRRRGLVKQLLDAIIERGRARGSEQAQISVFIGNDSARAAYIKAGFEPHDEKRDARYEAAMGTPGHERLLMRL